MDEAKRKAIERKFLKSLPRHECCQHINRFLGIAEVYALEGETLDWILCQGVCRKNGEQLSHCWIERYEPSIEEMVVIDLTQRPNQARRATEYYRKAQVEKVYRYDVAQLWERMKLANGDATFYEINAPTLRRDTVP